MVVFGALWLIYLLHKKSLLVNNKNNEKQKEFFMSKRKKDKVKKLDDQSYGEYISSLKEEKPIDGYKN